jgi:hypothetical protein
MIHLLCSPHCHCFIPFLHNFEYILNKSGLPAKVTLSYDPDTDDGTNLWFVIWNNLPVLPRKCIIYNMDPLVPHIEQGIRSLIQRSPNSTIVKFVDYTHSIHFERLADLNLDHSVLLYGYSSYHMYLKEKHVPKDIIQDIDILFYGNVTGRRIPYFQAIYALCQKRGYRFVIRNYDLFNEIEKITMIARSKIILSVASADTLACKTGDLARSAQVMSSGGFIITELVGDTLVESKLSKYMPFYSTLPELLQKLELFLDNPVLRNKLIRLTMEQFPKDFDMETDLIKLFL